MTAADLPSSVATLGVDRGTVTSWDDDRGWGEITTADGAVFSLHCTGIADGSRTVEVGADVVFHVAAGRIGRWEAWAVSPAPQR